MKKILSCIMLAVFFLMLMGCQLFGSHVENPPYQVIKQKGAIEHRLYPELLVAEVTVSGERKEALNEGFKLIADYIFGNNKTQKEISMTAPVEGQKVNQKIAMTAPVDQVGINKNEWTVRFYMPQEYNLRNIPKPNDERVILKVEPSNKFVAITFSGLNSDGNINKHLKILNNYVESEGLLVQKPHKTAFYNPPWTLPFLRRNEVMYQITIP
tara:strand:- start:20309 stop:20944 length:636 start_codon:yes stop_codon:yes gene_type:complete